MKKNDFIIVGILIVLMFGWMKFYPALEQKYFPRPEPPAAEAAPAASDLPVAPVAPVAAVEPVVAVIQKPDVAEQFETLSNEDIELTVSSYGGAVVSAILKNYPALNEEDSGPLVLDFEAAPALRYGGLPLSAGILKKTTDGVLYTVALGDGRVLQRNLTLDGEYLLSVEDSFVNQSAIPWALPALSLPTGPMSNPAGTTSMRGVSSLGVDSFAPIAGVTHWGRKFRKMEPGVRRFTSTSAMVPHQSVDWVAAKNKFFVQILAPEDGAPSFDLSVLRDGEGKKMAPAEVTATLQFNKELIGENETFVRVTRAYIGPKDFAFLKAQKMGLDEVMEFKSVGVWKFMNPVMFPIKKALLWGLIHLALFGNYGIAILLLTVIVRVIFWPLTHKGTESMRRMQALQPELKAIREKYKDNPQRVQQETMAFYKENKVNPMGGCLPMFVQVPVFIALYSVLRSAIELRFSGFLWISDLSEPENLFAGMIPVIGSLNILPLLMAVTMMWQQKLTPSGAGDAQQQKMMAVMMPIMMLFFFYSMPSGLVLYWTTSQVLMIIQMLIKKKKQA